MTKNIEKFKKHEEIRAVYLMTGSIKETAARLGLSYEYVQQVIAKTTKADEYHISEEGSEVANRIMALIMRGHEARMLYYYRLLISLENREAVTVSVCHKMPVTYREVDGKTIYYCLKCDKETNVITLSDADAHLLYRQVLGEMRKESIMLAEVAERLRFVHKEDNAIDVAGKEVGERDSKSIDSDDLTLVNAVRQLSPMDRLRLIERLEKRILESKGLVYKEEQENATDNATANGGKEVHQETNTDKSSSGS